jgi:hypothetical protein
MTIEAEVIEAKDAKEPVDWRAFARDHSGLLLTGAYILLIIVGLMYDVWLFLNFRVNILYYAEAADFLLVPLREPLVSILAIAPLPLWIWYMRFAQWLEKKIPGNEERKRKMEKRLGGAHVALRIRRIVSVLGVVMWSIAFTAHYANYVSRGIRNGEYRVTRVELVSGGAIEGQLIGTTSQFLFVYDRPALRARAIPAENIAQVVFPERKKKKN